MRAAILLVVVLTACTRQVAIGEVCEDAKQCGKGGDCYRGVCTPLCADDAECDGELVCARHHCLLATGEPRTAPKADGRKPIADGRLPKADGRSPKADGRLPIADDRLPSAEERKPMVEEAPRPGLRAARSDDPPVDVSLELRSIRTQLENIEKEQVRLNALLETLQKREQ